MRNANIRKEVIAALKDTGLPYEVVSGGHHEKVYLAGAFVTVLCREPGRGRDSKQAIARIKVAVREFHAHTQRAV